MKNFALSLLLLILLACRNDDFFISDNILNENHRQKFSIFTPKSPKDTIDYAKGFEILAKRYDSLYQTNFTGYKNLEKWKDNYPIPNHIDFTKHSQVITNDNSDKWMIFPKISNGKVSDLVIAYLVENETIVGFNTIDKNSDLFKLNISSFQKNYSSDNLFSKNLNRTNSYRPIPEVVIVVPKPITFPTYPIFGGGHGEIENIPGSDSCKYSLCTPNEGEGGGGGGNNYSSPDIIINNLNGRLRCIYNNLINSSNSFKNMIKKFDGEFPVSHLRISGRELPNGNAKTIEPINYITDIVINTQNEKLNRPNLSIARTIIHEIIHAEMYRKMLSLANKDGRIDTKKLKTMLSNGDYPGMFDYYTQYGINGMQHQQMASHYVNTISYFLKQYQPGLSNEIYESLAWSGLYNTTAWNNLSNSKREKILSIIKEFDEQGKENCR